jgi:hypothetical protein
MSGWIKLHRKMLEWEWYDDINVCRLWTHLLLKANHKDNRWKGVDVKAGQLITGRHSLSDETGLTEQQIRTALKKLKSTGEVTSKIHSKFSVITITSWPSYQTDNQQETQQATSKQPASNHKQECKELENEKNNPLSSGDDAPKVKKIPYEAIKEIYNDELPTLTGSRVLSDKSKRQIAAIWKQDGNHQNREFWTAYFSGCGQLSGKMENWTGVSTGNKCGTIELLTRNEIFVRNINEIIDAGIWA